MLEQGDLGHESLNLPVADIVELLKTKMTGQKAFMTLLFVMNKSNKVEDYVAVHTFGATLLRR